MLAAEQALSRRRLEHVVYTFAGERRALEVLFRADPFPHFLTLLRCQEFLRAFAHLFLRYGIVAEVLFQADEDDGDVGAALEDFGVPRWVSTGNVWVQWVGVGFVPFGCYVVEGVWT